LCGIRAHGASGLDKLHLEPVAAPGWRRIAAHVLRDEIEGERRVMLGLVPVLQGLLNNVNTTSALGRLKLSGQEFSRAYAEFYLLKDLATTHPVVMAEWNRLYVMSSSVRNVVTALNGNLDTANAFTEGVFGFPLSDLAGDYLNAYILSSLATLKFLTSELMKFNRSIILPMMKTGTAQ
jgi:hypothetical protein